MEPIDKFFAKWAKENGHDINELIDFMGWPSESNYEPYFEDIQHVLNDCHEDLNPPLPDELIKYYLSKWSGTNVPIDHPLVVNHRYWLDVYYKSEYDQAKPADEKQLYILIKSIAGQELLENLGSFQDLVDHVDSPDITGKICVLSINDEQYWLVVSDDVVVFMNSDGDTKAFSYDGDRLYKDQELPKVKNYIIGGMKFSRQVTDVGELASLIGNKLTSLIIGKDDISILDLP